MNGALDVMKDCAGVTTFLCHGDFPISEISFYFNELGRNKTRLRIPCALQRGQSRARPAKSSTDLLLSNNNVP
jgi:hypothetical protein